MFAVLHSMVLQLKLKSVSVMCTLSGGVYEFIDITLSPVIYDTLAPMNLFIALAPPGRLNIVNNPT